MKKETSKCKVIGIPIDIYNKILVVVIGDFERDTIASHIKREEDKKFFLEYTEKKDLSRYDGLVFNLGNGNNVLWLQSLTQSPDDVSTLAHEALHAAYDILKNVGIPLGNDSEEAYAYLISHITEKVLKFVQSKETKKSR